MPKISNRAWRIGAARAHPLGWASYIDPTYERAKHLHLLAEKLMAVECGEIKRLIVEMPPRHGKSETTTVKFPAWYLGRHPNHRIIIASHTASLAARFSMRARNDFAQYAPEIWGLIVNPDSSAMYQWDVLDKDAPPGEPPGGVLAAGVGGPITGHGAHLAVIDDPFKDAEQAHSQTQRDNIWDWYRYVLRTRLMPGGAVILVNTRWHEDDLAGRLLKLAAEDPDADQWEVLKLPAIAGENDPMGRHPGEALWPERYDEESLAKTRSSVGAYVWSALYQQRPQPAEGGLFKRSWFRYYHRDGEDWYVLRDPDGHRRISKHHCWKFATVDLAASLKQTADYTAAATWAVTPQNDLILLDMVRIRLEGPDQRQMIRDLFARHQPSFIGIERTGYQLTLIQELLREGLPIRELRPDGDKYARALVASARYEAGTVYHPATASWLGDFEDELLQFPNAAHDDMVDTVSYAAKVLADGGQSQATVSVLRRGMR